MGGKHSKCCCTAAVPGDVYVNMEFRTTPFASVSGQVWKYDGATGANSLFYNPASGAINSMCADRSGNLYLGLGGVIRKIDSTGSVVWTITPTSMQITRGLAVGKLGYLYAVGASSGGNAVRRRFYTSDGAEFTNPGSGWGTVSGTTLAFYCVCVDQNEIAHVGGRRNSTTPGFFDPNAWQLAATGVINNEFRPTESWTRGNFNSVALNAAGTEIVYTCSHGVAAVESIFTLDPANYSGSYTAFAHGAQVLSSAYSPNGDQYTAGRKNSGGVTVRRNTATYFSGEHAAAVGCGGDDSVFVGQLRPSASPNYSVLSVGVWGVDAGSQYNPVGFEPVTGRIGAFGNV